MDEYGLGVSDMIRDWLTRMFPKHRLTPSPGDVRGIQELYKQVFSGPAGRELIELWIETIVFANPRTTDPNECIAFTTKCAFIEDMIKALDEAQDPAKYQGQQEQVQRFDPRRAA